MPRLRSCPSRVSDATRSGNGVSRRKPARITNDRNFMAIKNRVLSRIFGKEPPLRLVDLDEQKKELHNILRRTVYYGESNSLLLIGGSSSGKTMLVNDVLSELRSSAGYNEDRAKDQSFKPFFEIKLNGAALSDKKLSLMEIVRQLVIEATAEEYPKGTFNENLRMILSTVNAGTRASIPIILVIDDIELFCNDRRQIFLYNIFNVIMEANSPVVLIGLTTRIDFTDLLEKRVKSRFSHNQVFLWQADTFKSYMDIIEAHVFLDPEKDSDICSPVLLESYNAALRKTLSSKTTREVFLSVYNFSKDVRVAMQLLYRPIMRISADNLEINPDDILHTANTELFVGRREILLSLSTLEMCLLISCFKHTFPKARSTCFELAFRGYKNFTLSPTRAISGRSKGVIYGGIILPRSVSLKAFENLLHHELIIPTDSTQLKRPKHLIVVKTACHIVEVISALADSQYFPEAVVEWAKS